MNSRSTTLIMTIAVLAGFAVILLMNMATFLGIEHSKYISPNNVRGIAVEHKGLLYTLNFDQQNSLIDIFNRSVPITQTMVEKRKAEGEANSEIRRIVIYQFNAPDIDVHLIGYVNKLNSAPSKAEKDPLALVFSSPEPNSQLLLEETAPGELQQLLSHTYDK
jgi:hypothetical protein